MLWKCSFFLNISSYITKKDLSFLSPLTTPQRRAKRKRKKKTTTVTPKNVKIRSAFRNAKSNSVLSLVGNDEVKEIAQRWDFSKPGIHVDGGDSRGASVLNGFNDLPKGTDFVAIHVGARARVTPKVIMCAMQCAQQLASGLCSMPFG